MAALFSCTKCHKRYPFEELSKGEQLCKECRNNFPVVKCTYCRVEFQQNSKGSTSSICAKCAQNVKYYGKPTACENCSILAAFIGNRCQRCVNSEKKWGIPLVCEQCKLKCAFNRPEKKKLDGKLMCWLCNQAYKRVLEKTRKSQEMILKTSQSSSSLVDYSSKSNTPTNNGQTTAASLSSQASASFEGMTVLERLTKLATSGGSSRGNTPPVDTDKQAKIEAESKLVDRQHVVQEKGVSGEDEVKEEKEKHRSHHRHHRKHSNQHHHHSRSKKHHMKDSDDAGDVKKPKSDKNPADGTVATSTPKSTDGYASDHGVDSAASENVILITQLREQIESLKKQMVIKDQQLVERDQKITELTVQMCQSETEFRAKVQTMHQSHATAIENCQIKNKELTRQVSLLAKNKKATDAS
ncbi:hypothetical protein BsWGS_13296 [Bradybaena similaris]